MNNLATNNLAMNNSATNNLATNNLAGLQILVVEDEALVAMLIEDVLTDIGCSVVGIASTFTEGMEYANRLAFDAAILDVNLQGQQSYPIAGTLAGRHVPFIFVTGYGEASILEELKHIQVIRKPFRRRDLERALSSAMR